MQETREMMKKQDLQSRVDIYAVGEGAVTLSGMAPVALSVQRRIWFTATTLKQHAFLTDIVPGMNNITVLFEPLEHDTETMIELVHEAWLDALKSDEMTEFAREIVIPVNYGGESGPDLQDVASHCGLSPNEIIERHTDGMYIVFFVGFQPGFAYLGGLDSMLHTPRRAEPRVRVPAGSVGIGGAQTGIYPKSSPGGWQLIGQTDVILFDPTREQPSLLLPGDRVRFSVKQVEI